jgi:predicted nucleic acid-binding protein
MAKKRIKKKSLTFVLDCSVTMAWYFKDEANSYANTVRKSLSSAGAVVPALWPLEVANILVLGERRQRSTEADASKWLRYLQMLPIQVDDETAVRAWSDILHVARSYDLSVYDAAYLELALRLALPLASLDDHLKATAASAGVAEFEL